MSKYLSQVIGAKRRVELRERPEPDDVSIIRPYLADLESKLAKDDPVRFCQIGRKYVVDTTEFRNLNGFHYIQALLKQPGEYIAATTMSPIGKQVVFEPVAAHSDVRANINKKHELVKKLQWKKRQRNSFDDYVESPYDREEELQMAEELLMIEKFLSKTTFNRKIKHIHNDYDRNRQTVSKCIRTAISYLEKHPSTSHIGHHLCAKVKTGARCRYLGKLIWIFI